MFKKNADSNEYIEEKETLNNKESQKNREKIFMKLYPTNIDDNSPKYSNYYQTKFSNYMKEKKKVKKLSNTDNLDDLFDTDGTYKINDTFLESIVKERCPLNKKKVHLTIDKFIKNSFLMEKIKKEFQTDNNESPENLCLTIAQNLSYTEYKRNKSIYKVGDNGDKLYFIIKGKVNIYKPIKINSKMTFKDYLLYCLLLNKYKEDFLLNKIFNTYFKIIPIMFIDEIKKAFNILFKMELTEKIVKKKILNNRELKLFFEDNLMNFDDCDIDIRQLEKYMPTKNKQKNGVINLVNEDKNLSGEEDWENYILTKCNVSYGESSYIEKFEKILKNNKKMDIECYIFEYVNSLEKGKYFGEMPVENDGSFIKKKRKCSIFAEEDTIIGTIKNEDFIYIIAPKIKIERLKNINFINNNYFFKPINTYIFARNYFQYFKRHELYRDNILFKSNTLPKSIFILQEGIITLNSQCTLIQLNEIIENLYEKLIINKYYTEFWNKKILTKQAINAIKSYANDYILKNLKLHNQKFVEEINKNRNLQISIVSKDEIIGLEEIFFNIPYFMNGIITSEKCIFYELPIEHFEDILKMESNIEEVYIKSSVNKLLSLIERLQNLKKNIIDYTKNKFDKNSDEEMKKKNEIVKIENNKENNNNPIKENILVNNYYKNENSLEKNDNNFNNNNKNNNIDNTNTINREISSYIYYYHKPSKRGFSSIKKQRINYTILENIKNEEKSEEKHEINDNSSENNTPEKAKNLKYARSAKRLTIRKKKYLYIDPIEQKERAGSVDIYKLKNHYKNKKDMDIDAIFVKNRYYTLESIKKSIERNKNKINIINKLYKKQNKIFKTVNKKEDEDELNKNDLNYQNEDKKYIKNNHKTINPDSNIDNNLYKNINIKFNIKKDNKKFKTINENRNIRYNRNIENLLNKNNNTIKNELYDNNDIKQNQLVISKNFLLSKSPSKLPKLNFDLKNKIKINLNSIKNSSSSRAIMDKIIEQSKKAIIPQLVKNFYDNKKIKGYIPFIGNKESNTLFLRKYHKKYKKNILHTEGNERRLPKIYKYMPLNKSINPDNLKYLK